ncbi:MAG: sigma-54 dependent transcriptional regulator, partial [Candidatus Poribacteria bacterium]|nr:sigma-54 dependent transcriptional regulator [Candidatus Poribacteria bacterium]
IHHNSLRQDDRFVAVNCGAIPDPLLESELFGYVPGAFTGASTQGKPGKFELADGGTIFLDEVSNMSVSLQVKLQRTLQEGEIERLGGTETIKINTRIIAATNQNLSKTVLQGDFREDLYYRFNRVLIKLPLLRDRVDDIPLLIEHFLKQINREANQNIRGVSSETMLLLQNYGWPGNVRELENAIKSAVVLSRSDVILPEHLPKEIQDPASTNVLQMDLKSTLLTVVKQAIELKKDSLYDELINTLDAELIPTAINACNQNQTQAAKLLGISRTTLIQKLKKGG